jgi:hypothetical protein
MKFLLTSLLVLWGCCAWAQSSAPKELTYSRVILLDSASVVPAGKVWKVESYMGDDPNYANGTPFLINGRPCWSFFFYIIPNPNPGSQTSSQVVQFPFWLPAGTSLSPWIDSQGRLRGQFSIIEFNEN